MSPHRLLTASSFVALTACVMAGAAAAEVCPARPGHSPRYVVVFDGTPEEMASLVPDETGNSSGRWQLGYVYEAGRVVTVRCRYEDGRTAEVTLSKKVNACVYKIDAKKRLKLSCE